MVPTLAYLDLLPPSDLFAVSELRTRISQKYQRDRRVKHFQESIAAIISLVEDGCNNSWKRALVCGICPVDDALAVNNARIQAFTGFSKSSINDLFAKMEYRPIPLNRLNQTGLIAKIPLMQSNHSELRQWTYRVRGRMLLNVFVPANTHAASPAVPIVDPIPQCPAVEPAVSDDAVDSGAFEAAESFAGGWDWWGDML
jgi:hypothetical protein